MILNLTIYNPTRIKKKHVLPLPGDICVVCKGPARDHSTAHAGVIYSTSWEHSEGRIWRTGDWGQGASGFDGDFGVSRYEPVAGTLSGISGTGAGKARALLGWVDIDLFYGTAA